MTLEARLEEIIERGTIARVALERLRQIDSVVRVKVSNNGTPRVAESEDQ